ncbi:DUF3784 domain-containing protein [Clostridium sp.]
MVICRIFGKDSWMILGCNSMSKEEKANCNIEKISRAIGFFIDNCGAYRYYVFCYTICY